MRFLIIFGLVISSMVFNVSCSSKKKKSAGETSQMEGDVSSKSMNFDPMGSDSGNIAGLATVHFDYDKAALTAEARRLLSENANWMKEKQGMTIQIEGHCDKRGSVEYNLALGERRAQATKNYLVSLGVDGKRITIISYGKEKPISFGDTDSDFSKNRRANFVPLPN